MPERLRLRIAVALICAATAITPALAQRARVLDRANLDTTCAPCTDFYEFANGSWLKRNTIPPDKTSLGSFGMLGDKNQEVVQKIVIDDANLVRDGEAKAGTNDWKIGTFYLACMDTAALETAGFADQADARRDRRGEDDRRRRASVMGIARRRRWRRRPWRRRRARAVLASDRAPIRRTARWSFCRRIRAGSRSTARTTSARTIARSSVAPTTSITSRARCSLIGESDAQAAADAKTILALETAIAKITIPQADMRDPVATYHKMTLAEFGKMTPHVNWTRYLQQQGARTPVRRQRARARLLHGARLAARRDAGRAMEGVHALARASAARWGR